MAISPVASYSSVTSLDFGGLPLPNRVPENAAPAVVTSSQEMGGQGRENQQRSSEQQQVERAVTQANEALSQRGSELYAAFERDKDTGISIIRIVDKRTNETVVQMPPQAMVAFAQTLQETQNARGQLLSDMA